MSLLIVDYLQLMEGRGNSESRQQEISDISRALKGLAKELNIYTVSDLQKQAQQIRFASQGEFEYREDGIFVKARVPAEIFVSVMPKSHK